MARNSKGDLKRLGETEQLFRRALELSKSATKSDLDELSRLIAQRDTIFLRTKDLLSSFPVHQDGTIELDEFDQGHRPEAGNLVDAIRNLIEELVSTDETIRKRLEGELAETREKIGEIDLGRHRLKAYAPFAKRSPHIFQRKG